MLKQLAQHRWVFFVQAGLTLLLGVCLLYLRELLYDEVTGTFVFAVGVLTSGFVVLAAALLDLAIALEVTAREHTWKASLVWWLMGVAGVAVGLEVLLAAEISFRLVGFFATAHAVLSAALNLSLLPSLRRHPLDRQFYVASSMGFLIFAIGLLLSAIAGDAPAAKTVGIYAVFFGLQLFYLGTHLPAKHRVPLALPHERRGSHAQ
jgi:uncharacterized membrane protein HdeD (DUF308 family)